MAQPRVAVWGFVVAGILAMVAAFIPVLRGGTMNAVFFPVGVVFLILAAAINKNRPPTDSPPAA